MKCQMCVSNAHCPDAFKEVAIHCNAGKKEEFSESETKRLMEMAYRQGIRDFCDKKVGINQIYDTVDDVYDNYRKNGE